MSKLFKLVVQTPKLKSLGVGTLSVLNNEAYFFAGHGEKGAEVLAVMHKPVLEFAGASSIKLTGIEPVRLRHNIQEYAYQEWFLHYLDGERATGEIGENGSQAEQESLFIDQKCESPVLEKHQIELRAKCMVWLANGETGTSSKAMVFCACDIDYEDQCHPLDPSDLNRCIKAVKAIPEIKQAFDKIAKLSDEWFRVIQYWDELTGLFIEEVGHDWSKGRSAPLTYKRMKELKL